MNEAATRRLGVGFWGFIAFMLTLTVLFIGLGVWQVNRLGWKEGLIAEVSARLTQPPLGMPAPDHWTPADLAEFSFHPVKLRGHYEPAKTILVFTNLSEPKGKYGGPGYWMMVPMVLDTGGTAFVNLGFIPQDKTGQKFTANSSETTLTAIALDPEETGPFTPAPDTAKHIDWLRNPARLATLAGIPGPIFPMTLDAPPGAAGALPQGGETVVDFPNNHFGYALTWFGFALLTPALLAFWIWRQLKPQRHSREGGNPG